MNFMASRCGSFEWWNLSNVETLRKKATLEYAPNYKYVERKKALDGGNTK
jgi:hypothetical protein